MKGKSIKKYSLDPTVCCHIAVEESVSNHMALQHENKLNDDRIHTSLYTNVL